MSCFRCQLVVVSCNYYYYYNCDKVSELVGEGSVINKAYPVQFMVTYDDFCYSVAIKCSEMLLIQQSLFRCLLYYVNHETGASLPRKPKFQGNYTVLYTTIQYYTVQYSTKQYNTVQYRTIQYTRVHYSAVLQSTMQCSALQCKA